jgi:hypothetical protein
MDPKIRNHENYLRRKQAKQFQKEHPYEPLPEELLPRKCGRPPNDETVDLRGVMELVNNMYGLRRIHHYKESKDFVINLGYSEGNRTEFCRNYYINNMKNIIVKIVDKFNICIPKLSGESDMHYQIFIEGEVPEDIDFEMSDTLRDMRVRMKMMLKEIHYKGEKEFKQINLWLDN